jgi:hypothetical protein
MNHSTTPCITHLTQMNQSKHHVYPPHNLAQELERKFTYHHFLIYTHWLLYNNIPITILQMHRIAAFSKQPQIFEIFLFSKLILHLLN